MKTRGIPEEYAFAFLPLILFIFIYQGRKLFRSRGVRSPRRYRGPKHQRPHTREDIIWKWVFFACVVWAVGGCIWIYTLGEMQT